MAITRHLAELILAEHRYRPIRGETLLLGRQLVVMTPDEALALVEKSGLRPSSKAFIDYDKTPHPFPKKLISDASFFSLFSESVVRACDVSDYEGAEIIFSLSDDLPASLLAGFDFIYNGSVLDNVFDAAACIRNVSRLLKPDGVVFHYEGIAHSSPAYLKFSPDWFFDYYALNDFADFQGYIATYEDVHRDRWDIYEWSAFTPQRQLTMPMILPLQAMVIAVAQNAPSASTSKTPIENVYRPGGHDHYLAAFDRYAASARREVIRSLLGMRQAAQPVLPKPKQSLLDRLLGRAQALPTPPLAAGHLYLGKLGSPEFLGEAKPS